VPEVLLGVMSAAAQASPKTLKLACYSRRPQEQDWVKTIKAGLKELGIPASAMDTSLISRISTEPFTVLIMVPTLKSHEVAGVSGVIKHFATISKEGPQGHHPNAMKTAGSVIVPQFGHLRKLIIVDALRFYRTLEGEHYFQKSLIFGTDPVATDTIALDLFLKHCIALSKIPPRLHIEAADKEYKAGTCDRAKIEVRTVEL